MNAEIALERLDNQHVAEPSLNQPAAVVAWLGAVQAQEHAAAKWALALRMLDGAGDNGAAIERALSEGRILRTHVMRPTWHFVAASDIRWMLELTAPRVHRALAYASRRFELDTATRVRATKAFERALDDGRSLTRTELGARLARAGIAARGVRLALLTVHAELEGVICSGPRRGKEMTYALLASRVPQAWSLSRDEALAELTTRYFRSHGPATLRDFMWWSGLTSADAKRGLDIASGRQEVIDGLSYWRVRRSSANRPAPTLVRLLPIYDEYLVAYRDLDAVPRKSGSRGRLEQALVAGGQVAGTWKPVATPDGLVVDVSVQRTLTRLERRALAEEAARYGRFLGKTVSVQIG